MPFTPELRERLIILKEELSNGLITEEIYNHLCKEIIASYGDNAYETYNNTNETYQFQNQSNSNPNVRWDNGNENTSNDAYFTTNNLSIHNQGAEPPITGNSHSANSFMEDGISREDRRQYNHGARQRRSYSLEDKVFAISLKDVGKSIDEIAAITKVPKSNLEKWCSDKAKQQILSKYQTKLVSLMVHPSQSPPSHGKPGLVKTQSKQEVMQQTGSQLIPPNGSSSSHPSFPSSSAASVRPHEGSNGHGHASGLDMLANESSIQSSHHHNLSSSSSSWKKVKSIASHPPLSVVARNNTPPTLSLPTEQLGAVLGQAFEGGALYRGRKRLSHVTTPSSTDPSPSGVLLPEVQQRILSLLHATTSTSVTASDHQGETSTSQFNKLIVHPSHPMIQELVRLPTDYVAHLSDSLVDHLQEGGGVRGGMGREFDSQKRGGVSMHGTYNEVSLPSWPSPSYGEDDEVYDHRLTRTESVSSIEMDDPLHLDNPFKKIRRRDPKSFSAIYSDIGKASTQFQPTQTSPLYSEQGGGGGGGGERGDGSNPKRNHFYDLISVLNNQEPFVIVKKSTSSGSSLNESKGEGQQDVKPFAFPEPYSQWFQQRSLQRGKGRSGMTKAYPMHSEQAGSKRIHPSSGGPSTTSVEVVPKDVGDEVSISDHESDQDHEGIEEIHWKRIRDAKRASRKFRKKFQ